MSVSTTNRRAGRVIATAGLFCALLAPIPAGAQALSADQVARQVAAEYDVEVLRVLATEGPEGGAAYAVTVMLPGGSRNNAFQVTTVLVDGDSGELIPQFRHGPTGHELSGAPSFLTPGTPSGPVYRRSLTRPSG